MLVLRDVLGFRAGEVAEMLDTSEASVNSLLRRARAAFESRLPAAGRERAPLPNSKLEREIVGRFADAVEAGDVDGMVALLTDDAWLTMPPLPQEYQGHDAIGAFLRGREERRGAPLRLVPTRANSQPAFGCYLPVPETDDRAGVRAVRPHARRRPDLRDHLVRRHQRLPALRTAADAAVEPTGADHGVDAVAGRARAFLGDDDLPAGGLERADHVVDRDLHLTRSGPVAEQHQRPTGRDAPGQPLHHLRHRPGDVDEQARHQVVRLRRRRPGAEVGRNPLDPLGDVGAERLRRRSRVVSAVVAKSTAATSHPCAASQRVSAPWPAPASSARPGGRPETSASRCAFGGRPACAPLLRACDQRRSQESRPKSSPVSGAEVTVGRPGSRAVLRCDRRDAWRRARRPR